VSERVLVRGGLGGWKLYIPAILATVAILLAIFEDDISDDPAIQGGFLLAGGGLIMLQLIVFGVQYFRRQWLELDEDSFVVSGFGGRRQFRDDDVSGIRSYCQHHYGRGLLTETTYYLTVWCESAGEVNLATTFKVDGDGEASETNPVPILDVRLTERLTERAGEDLQAGRPLVGDGWQLETEGLRVTGGAESDLIRFKDISALGVFDDQFCIWKSGEEQPALRIPPISRNLDVLRPLLDERVTEEDDGGAPSVGILGRVLFERNDRPLFLWVVSGAAVIGGGALIYSGLNVVEPGPYYTFGAICIVGGLLLGAACLRLRKTFLRCQEYGVRQVTFFGEKVLRYDEMASFNYKGVRHFVNGMYQGTNLELLFRPEPGFGKPSIAYKATVQGDDDALEGIQEHISGVIAAGMGERLAAGEAVPWTPNLRFLPDGLEHRRKGFIGRKDSVVYAYDQIGSWSIDEGVFFLNLQGQENAAFQEEVSEPNFFPGFALLVNMLSPDEENEEEEEAGEEETEQEETEEAGEEYAESEEEAEYDEESEELEVQ
jgi:hypothetical protein